MSKGTRNKPQARSVRARKVLKELKKEGWTFKYGQRHTRAYPPGAPNGELGFVTLLATEKNNRNWDNMLAQIERTRREAKQQQRKGA